MNWHPARVLVHSLGVAGALAIVGFGYFAGFAPLMHDLDRNDSLRKQATDLATSLPQRRDQLEQLKSEREALNSEVGRLKQRFTQEAGPHQLLVQYSEIATQTGVTLDDFQPQGGETEGSVRECFVALTLSGTYQSICRFLVAIDELPRLQDVVRLSLKPLSEDRSSYQLELHLGVSYGKLPQFVSHP